MLASSRTQCFPLSLTSCGGNKVVTISGNKLVIILGDNEMVTMETVRELIPLKVTYLNLLSYDVVKIILFL